VSGNLSWDDIRVVLAIMRAKNLGEAGARVGLDASTVSRRLAVIEKGLGAKLFSRTRDGLRPTQAAERVRRHAEVMEVEAASIVKGAVATDGEVRGVVRVATTDALARVLVAEGLLRVREEHPDLMIEILGGNRPVDLSRGEADIAVRIADPDKPALRARCVAKMGVALFASPAYLRARGAVRSAASLRGHDVLLPTGELARLPESKWLASRAGVHPVFRSNSMPALVAAAIGGHGLVPLPIGWGDSERELERAFVLESIPSRKVWLVTHEDAMDRPATKVVAEKIAVILGRIFAA
jgi:DNA-binding transcriptional LysR family regulator